jgi:Xaa-Pro aminopeptidase
VEAPAVLIYGDTERCAELRHEVPIPIGDPFLYLEREGRRIILTNVLERDRLARALPDAELVLIGELGYYDLLREGVPEEEAELTVVRRAVARAGLTRAAVPRGLPVQIADALRADGVALDVDGQRFDARRRAKSAAERAGVRRAQAAAEHGLAAGAALLRAADIDGDRLVLDGAPLTAERVRATVREACASRGAPAPPDIMVVSAWSGGGHDPGSGPLPARLPIEIDLWPRDEATGCWADMTRTFVVGEVSAEIARLREVALAALEAARALARPGAAARALYDAAAQVVEDAGFPTQRTQPPGEPLDHGFYFSLGHGVGLELHEAPVLGLASDGELVDGDVIAVEPGIEGLDGIGGVRFEDLLLVAGDGCDTLTDSGYELAP